MAKVINNVTWFPVFSTAPTQPELKYAGIVYSRKKMIVYPARIRIDLLHPGDFVADCKLTLGIANLKIQGNEWVSGKLIIGGRVEDTIYRKLDQTSFPMLDNGNCFPVHPLQNIYLEIDGEYESVTYDVVVLDSRRLESPWTFRGYQMARVNKSAENLPFNFGVEKLTVRSSHPLSGVQLQIGHSWLTLPFRKEKDQDGAELPFTYVLDIFPALNFSYIEELRLCFVPSDPAAEVFVTALYFNTMKEYVGGFNREYVAGF